MASTTAWSPVFISALMLVLSVFSRGQASMAAERNAVSIVDECTQVLRKALLLYLFQRLGLDLPYPFPGYTEDLTDFRQGMFPLGTDPMAQSEHLGFPGGQNL